MSAAGDPPEEPDTGPPPWRDPAAEPVVRIRGLSKRFDALAAVDGIDLDVYPGELFAILGGSGCGKSTLLRMLAGFEQPSAGEILIDGVDMTAMPPYRRPVNIMFQSYALFPHMSVAENVAYGLKKEGVERAEINRRVGEMLELVRLSPLAKRKPARLSGGEGQRVALARALIKRPKLLLLDEPLAALDKKLREHTQFELMNLQDELGITFIVVTHDQEEAMTLSTRIAVMNAGRFEQVGTPGEIYEYPDNRFVADFVGTINLLEVRLLEADSNRALVHSEQTGGTIAVRGAETPAGERHWLAIRPEKISIGKERPAGDGRTVLKGTVLDLGYFGNRSLFKVRLDGGVVLQVSATNRRRRAHHVMEWDDEVYLYWDEDSALLLSE